MSLHSATFCFIYFTGNGTTTFVNIDVDPLDIVIVISMVAAWFISLTLFVHKWGKMRISRSPMSFAKPKNLDTIQVTWCYGSITTSSYVIMRQPIFLLINS